jgi:hypothetical protein
MTNRFSGYADNGGVPVEKYTPVVARTAKPRNPTKPKVRNARNVPIDDEIGDVAEAKKGMAMTDINRGPFQAMMDRQALARQAQTGESYAAAFTKVYTDPANAEIRDLVRLDHLAKQSDAMHGTKLSLIPAAKAAPPDAVQDDVSPGSAHAELNELVVARMKREPKLSYEQAFTREYLHPDNRSLKERVTAEGILHAQRLAPAKPFPPYVAPGHRG